MPPTQDCILYNLADGDILGLFGGQDLWRNQTQRPPGVERNLGFQSHNLTNQAHRHGIMELFRARITDCWEPVRHFEMQTIGFVLMNASLGFDVNHGLDICEFESGEHRFYLRWVKTNCIACDAECADILCPSCNEYSGIPATQE